jgi:O-methyltransferase
MPALSAGRFLARVAGRLLFPLRRWRAGVASDRHAVVLPTASYAPWNTDTAFLAAYAATRDHTLVDELRCWELWQLVAQTAPLAGALVEVGVWRGGTGVLIARRAADCGIADPVYLCDTFAGVVKAGEMDPDYAGGEHADTSLGHVRDLVAGLGLANVRLLRGVFPEETAPQVREGRVRFVHIDVDVYRSAVDVLAWAWPRMPVGGIVVYDDYGFLRCDGIARHVDEQRGLPDRVVLHNLNGHAVVVKTGA